MAEPKRKKIEPGSEDHLTLLMAPHSLNLVVGQDRQHLLAWGRDVWQAALKHAAKSEQDMQKQPCLCTFAQRMQGDGCEVCNPELAADLAGTTGGA